MKRAFNMKKKAFFRIFKGLSVVRNSQTREWAFKGFILTHLDKGQNPRMQAINFRRFFQPSFYSTFKCYCYREVFYEARTSASFSTYVKFSKKLIVVTL